MCAYSIIARTFTPSSPREPPPGTTSTNYNSTSRFHSMAIHIKAFTTHVPPPLATYITIGRPIVHTPVLPLRCREIARKRVVFHSPLSPSSPNSPLTFHHHQFHSHHVEHHLYHHISETLFAHLTCRLGSVHNLTHHYHLSYSQPFHNHIPLPCYELSICISK